MFRLFFLLAIALGVTWCSTSVKLGEHSLAGHVHRIWTSEEGKDLRDGVKEQAASESTQEVLDSLQERAMPVIERVQRGVEAGIDEALQSDVAQSAKSELKDTAKAAIKETAKETIGESVDDVTE